jgi:hypothetical protein
MKLLRLTTMMVLALALGLTAAACGGDDDTDSSTTESTAAAAPLTLTGEETSVVLDSGTAKVLTDNGVAVAPVAPASASGKGISFPITGGEINTEDLSGTIDHSGGLSFTAGGTTVELTDFVVDTVNGTLTSTVGGADLTTLDLDLSGVQQSDDNGVIVLEGITATLTADAATALNDAFGVTFFAEGLAFADVTVRAAG